MSEGRLAPVRETDRHAAMIAGCAAALCSAATLGFLHLIGLQSEWRGSRNTSPGVVMAVACTCGFIAGAAEGALASRMARSAASHFQPLPELATRIGRFAAALNVLVAIGGVSLTFDGEQRIVALIISVIVAVVASACGAAVFAWSHAVDWPAVPDFARGPGVTRDPAVLMSESADNVAVEPRSKEKRARFRGPPAPDLDYEAGRNEVVNEPRSRRRASEEKEVWSHPQDLISGR